MYRIEIQATPTIHDGLMQYYWLIYTIIDGAKITVEDGWSDTLYWAVDDAYDAVLELV